MSQEADSYSSKVKCPVCNKSINEDIINEHLDECCLKETDGDDDEPIIVSKRPKISHVSTDCRNEISVLSNNASNSDRQSTVTEKSKTNSPTIGLFYKKNDSPKQRPSNSQTTLRNVWKMSGNVNSKKNLINGNEKASSSFSSSPCANFDLGDQLEFENENKSHNSQQTAVKLEVDTNLKRKTGISSGNQFQPLAELVRPILLEEYQGQENVLGSGSMLRKLIEAHNIPSMILWGPPGCGKTSLAHIISKESKKRQNSHFVSLSATSSGIKDVKTVMDKAKNDLALLKRQTILFLDEIHRFNKLQQDIFLPYVEDGTITLIGATTENPSFVLNNALLSRCRVIVLEKLSVENIQLILRRALQKLEIQPHNTASTSQMNPEHQGEMFIEEDALTMLAEFCDGDARVALNGLQMAVQAIKQENYACLPRSGQDSSSSSLPKIITKKHIQEGLQKTHLLYDRTGDQHYDTISAYIKSMRGSDQNAALYWLARMLEGGEDPRFIARRLVIFASEDIGMADSKALDLATSTFQACQFVGMPESKMMLSHCTVYMARAPKSRECCDAYKKAEELVRTHQGPLPPVPLHLRNAPTRLMKDLGYAKGYKMYNHDGTAQPFLPESLKYCNFFS